MIARIASHQCAHALRCCPLLSPPPPASHLVSVQAGMTMRAQGLRIQVIQRIGSHQTQALTWKMAACSDSWELPIPTLARQHRRAPAMEAQ